MKRRHKEELNEVVGDNHKLQIRIEDGEKYRDQQR